MSTTIILAPEHASAPIWRRLVDAAKRGLRRPAETPEQARLRNAAEVRALACEYLGSDPGFASDLYAAVDCHEREQAA